LVKAAFITVYSYEHRSEEIWRDGTLSSLRSETHDDGQAYRVDGSATTDGFRLLGSGGPFIAPARLLTSNSMWLSSIVTQENLIDAQHGGVIGVTARKIGSEELVGAQGPMIVTRYKFMTPHCAGDIWYDAREHWVRAILERNGARIE